MSGGDTGFRSCILQKGKKSGDSKVLIWCCTNTYYVYHRAAKYPKRVNIGPWNFR